MWSRVLCRGFCSAALSESMKVQTLSSISPLPPTDSPSRWLFNGRDDSQVLQMLYLFLHKFSQGNNYRSARKDDRCHRLQLTGVTDFNRQVSFPLQGANGISRCRFILWQDACVEGWEPCVWQSLFRLVSTRFNLRQSPGLRSRLRFPTIMWSWTFC